MSIEASLNKLFSLHTFGMKLGLDNIQKFLNHIGNPQKKLKTFHIAGSNGKGSTASFIASILMEDKYRTGLYTSPHFVKFNERIKIDGKEIPDDYVHDFIQSYETFINEHNLTFFEVTTAMAFRYFRDKKAEYSVIETGLGGRLDATNVLNPGPVIITSISLEHTNILGDSIESIAFEKAGIIKSGCTVFTGMLPEEAKKIIVDKCVDEGCDIFILEDYINEKPHSLELYTEEIELDEWVMPLKGYYQKYNAALAGLAVSKTLDLSDNNIITAGIKGVIKNTGLQGRFEYYSINPDIILDSAHNPDGIEKFISEFKKERSKYKRCSVLFAALKDKAVLEMLGKLKNYFDEFFFTSVENDRSTDTGTLLKISEQLGINGQEIKEKEDFINQFITERENECLVILGSMYLLGEIKTFQLSNKKA